MTIYFVLAVGQLQRRVVHQEIDSLLSWPAKHVEAGVNDKIRGSVKLVRIITDQLNWILLVKVHLVAQVLCVETPPLKIRLVVIGCSRPVPRGDSVSQKIRNLSVSCEDVEKVVACAVEVEVPHLIYY